MLVFRGVSLILKMVLFQPAIFLLHWRVVYLHDQSVEMRDRTLGQRFVSAVTSWWFEILLCSPLSLGFHDPI